MASVWQRQVELYRDCAWRTWWLLARECRNAGAQVSTSKALDLTLDRIVEDIRSGRDIRDFLKIKDELFQKRDNGRGCSKVFLEFVKLLRQHMAVQGTLDIEPIRATELLFDYALDRGQPQHALRIIEEFPGTYSLVTTTIAEQTYKEAHRLLIPKRHIRDRWADLGSKRDRPAKPTLAGS